MPRYIDAYKMLHELSFYADRPTKRAMAMIKTLPEEDVAPVIHAKIFIADDGFVRCSACNKTIRYPLTSFSDIEYCPRCGAKMDEEEQG